MDLGFVPVNTPPSSFAVVQFEEANDEARAYMMSMLDQFQSPSGVVLFTLSLLMTRGIESIEEDMDDPSTTLIGQFGHCSQELLNLLITGRATSNVFDGESPSPRLALSLTVRRDRQLTLTSLPQGTNRWAIPASH